MQKRIKLFELIGLTIILSSFFIQTFILLPSQTTTTGSIRYKIEKKIDTIYNITRSNFQKLNPDIKEPIFLANSKLFSNYDYADQDTEIVGTYRQTKVLKYLVSILFIVGSFFMIAAKYLDYKQTHYSLPTEDKKS
jgi:hypothetical protein